MPLFKRKTKKDEPEKKATQVVGPIKRGDQGEEKEKTRKGVIPKETTMTIGQAKKPSRIEVIRAPETIAEGQILKIQVSGHFPNLGWSLEGTAAEVRENEIIVAVYGKRKEGMAGQALKPFSAVIDVSNLQKGEYLVKDASNTAEPTKIIVS